MHSQLLGKRAPRGDQHHACGGFQEAQVFLGDLVRISQKNPSGLVDPRIHGIGLDQPFEFLLKRPFISAGFLIEDDEIRPEAVFSPVAMRLEHLADQSQIARFADRNHRDGEIPRDAVRP